MKKTLGILGGLGPAATSYFFDILTSHTAADCDSGHLNVIISSRADTPDRSAYILGKSRNNPTAKLRREVRKLIFCGAEVIAVPCNTAHYYTEGFKVPGKTAFLDMPTLTAEYLCNLGISSVGVMSTEGTHSCGIYRTALETRGIAYIPCDNDDMERVSEIIFGKIKKDIVPDIGEVFAVAERLRAKGAETVLLGCTELSFLGKYGVCGEIFTDPLDILAACAITECGGNIKNFPVILTEFCEKYHKYRIEENVDI